MKAYSLDFRKRVLAMCDRGRPTREVARVLLVSESWVRRLKQRRRDDGSIAPRPAGGPRRDHFDSVRLSQLERWLHREPDATLERLRSRVAEEMGLRCSLMAVCRALKKLGWSLEKRRFEPANKTGRK